MKGAYLKYFGVAIIVLGVFACIPVGFHLGGVLGVVIFLAVSCIAGMFFIGFGELVYSLQRIELEIAGERPQYDPLTGQYQVPPKDNSR